MRTRWPSGDLTEHGLARRRSKPFHVREARAKVQCFYDRLAHLTAGSKRFVLHPAHDDRLRA